MNTVAEAVSVITRLRMRGIGVRLADGRLVAGGPADQRLAAEDRAVLRALRSEIIRLLRQEADEPEPGTFDGSVARRWRPGGVSGGAAVHLSSSWPGPGSWQYDYATRGAHPLWCATCRGRTRRPLADGFVGCPRCSGT